MIHVEVNEREARCRSAWPITSGSVGLTAVFRFSKDWEGLSAVAVFRGSGAEADVALSAAACPVPPQVLAEAGGLLRIGVFGQAPDGRRVIPTVWATAGRIEEGTEPSGFDPAEPAPSWSAQVQAAAAAALERASLFPAGGEAGQVLVKQSGADFDAAWEDPTGGGTADYDALRNRPQIGGVTLSGNQSASELHLATPESVAAAIAGAAELFWAVYGSTSAAAVLAKVNANVLVLCRYNGDVYRCRRAASSGGSVSGVIRAFFTCFSEGKSRELTVEDRWGTAAAQAVWSNAEADYAPLASPAFTGSPSAPTPTDGDNSSRLATTAFVQAAIGGAGAVASVNGKTGAVVLTASDVGAYAKPSGGIPKTDLAAAVRTSLGKADTALQQHQSLAGYATETWVTQQGYLTAHQDISGKADKPNAVTQSAPTSLTLADNTEYYLTNVGSLTLSYPSATHWECWLQITTKSSGTVSVSLPTSSYIGSAPTFGNGETWEISIRDGVVVAGKAAS